MSKLCYVAPKASLQTAHHHATVPIHHAPKPFSTALHHGPRHAGHHPVAPHAHTQAIPHPNAAPSTACVRPPEHHLGTSAPDASPHTLHPTGDATVQSAENAARATTDVAGARLSSKVSAVAVQGMAAPAMIPTAAGAVSAAIVVKTGLSMAGAALIAATTYVAILSTSPTPVSGPAPPAPTYEAGLGAPHPNQQTEWRTDTIDAASLQAGAGQLLPSDAVAKAAISAEPNQAGTTATDVGNNAPVPVPEPSSLCIVALSIIAAGCLSVFRRKPPPPAPPPR